MPATATTKRPSIVDEGRDLLLARLALLDLPDEPGFSGPLVRGEFVRELANTLDDFEKAAGEFRRLLVWTAYRASEPEDATAAGAIDALDMIGANVSDEMLPHLRHAADLLLGEYGVEDPT